MAVIKPEVQHTSLSALVVGKVKWSFFPKSPSVQITHSRVTGVVDWNLLSQGQVLNMGFLPLV